MSNLLIVFTFAVSIFAIATEIIPIKSVYRPTIAFGYWLSVFLIELPGKLGLIQLTLFGGYFALIAVLSLVTKLKKTAPIDAYNDKNLRRISATFYIVFALILLFVFVKLGVSVTP